MTPYEALRYAIQVMEAYQVEIRNRGLDKEGFCQGVIFTEAPEKLREALKATEVHK